MREDILPRHLINIQEDVERSLAYLEFSLFKNQFFFHPQVNYFLKYFLFIFREILMSGS